MACHLCALIGLPHVEYELAAEYDGQQYMRPGVVCENMARKPVVLVLGNQLLLAVDPDYPHSQRFRVRQHTVEAVSAIVAQLSSPPDDWVRGVPDGVKSALDVFAGYVMVDVWITNVDRHHENWAALWDGCGFCRARTERVLRQRRRYPPPGIARSFPGRCRKGA